MSDSITTEDSKDIDTVLLNAVKTNGLMLQLIQDSYKTEELCTEAIKQNPKAFRYIPSDKITYKMCLEAVSADGLIIKDIPSKHLSLELYEAAVKQNGVALYYININEVNNKILTAAVNQNGLVLKIIPPVNGYGNRMQVLRVTPRRLKVNPLIRSKELV